MTSRLFPGLALLLVGCTGSSETTDTDADTTDTDTDTTDTDTDTTDTDTDEPQGACGDVTVWDVVLRGTVEDAFGNPLTGATVTLEDRGWMPTTVLATATSDNKATFTLQIFGLTSVEDCWGTLLDYVVVGSTNLGHVGEEDVNPPLFDAVNTGTLEADMPIPLVLDYPEE